MVEQNLVYNWKMFPCFFALEIGVINAIFS